MTGGEKRFPTHIVAVDGVVEREDGSILLVKTRGRNQYCVPGGQVETGEDLIEALKREIREEAGVEVDVGRLLCVSSNTRAYPGTNGYAVVPTKVMLGFACAYVSGELRTSDETSECLWVPKDRVLEYVTVPYLAERFKAYLNSDRGVQYLAYHTKPAYRLLLKRMI